MASNDINLLQAKTTLDPGEQALEEWLRMSALILLGILVVGGVLVGSAYWFLQTKYNALFGEKRRLTSAIASQAKKEALFLSVKDRVGVAQKVYTNRSSWSPVLNTITKITNVARLTSITVDDSKVVTITLTSPSLDDAIRLLNDIVQLTNQKQIRSPQLVSFQLDERGGLRVVISFMPVS